MKRLLIMVGVLMIFLAGCGGGGGSDPVIPPPPPKDSLLNIQGLWKGALSKHLVLDFEGEINTIDSMINITFLVTEDDVLDGSGSLPWQYDGTTLTIQVGGVTEDWDFECGWMYISQQIIIKMQCNSTTTAAPLNATLSGTVTTDFCGNGTISGTYSGTMIKQ